MSHLPTCLDRLKLSDLALAVPQFPSVRAGAMQMGNRQYQTAWSECGFWLVSSGQVRDELWYPHLQLVGVFLQEAGIKSSPPIRSPTPPTYHSKYVGDVLHAKLLALGWPELKEALHVDTELLLLLLAEAVHMVLQVIDRDQAAL